MIFLTLDESTRDIEYKKISAEVNLKYKIITKYALNLKQRSEHFFSLLFKFSFSINFS
jgi:predicted transcriptional regulator